MQCHRRVEAQQAFALAFIKGALYGVGKPIDSFVSRIYAQTINKQKSRIRSLNFSKSVSVLQDVVDMKHRPTKIKPTYALLEINSQLLAHTPICAAHDRG